MTHFMFNLPLKLFLFSQLHSRISSFADEAYWTQLHEKGTKVKENETSKAKATN